MNTTRVTREPEVARWLMHTHKRHTNKHTRVQLHHLHTNTDTHTHTKTHTNTDARDAARVDDLRVHISGADAQTQTTRRRVRSVCSLSGPPNRPVLGDGRSSSFLMPENRRRPATSANSSRNSLRELHASRPVGLAETQKLFYAFRRPRVLRPHGADVGDFFCVYCPVPGRLRTL